MKFNPGFKIETSSNPFGFIYGDETFGPNVEIRKLDAIRKTLKDPNCLGPEEVYAIAMDIGLKKDLEILKDLNLLYGAVTYATGSLGEEPIRSQGHIHAVSKSCGFSTAEVYEIWSGSAYIYMQEYVDDVPGRCYAVHALVGDVVIVPPNWGHATISASPNEELTFGAWCVRDYGFEYESVRKYKGLSYFPIIKNNEIIFKKNENYQESQLIIKTPREYNEFKIKKNIPIYTQFEQNNNLFLFVTNPEKFENEWREFTP